MSHNNLEQENINEIIFPSSLKRKRDVRACWLTPEEQQEREKEDKRKTKKQREDPNNPNPKPKKKKKSNKDQLKEKFGF